jgi:threonine aldolase
MAKARRYKHLFGGAMRQAGIVAAAGVYALDHHVDRLAEDHANARRLAEGLADAGLPVDLDQVETNFVQLDAARLGMTADEAITRLRAEGVLLSFAARKDVLRALTHLDISADDVEDAIEGTVRAFSGSQRPVELAGEAPTPY